jgi:hypothetical protein
MVRATQSGAARCSLLASGAFGSEASDQVVRNSYVVHVSCQGFSSCDIFHSLLNPNDTPTYNRTLPGEAPLCASWCPFQGTSTAQIVHASYTRLRTNTANFALDPGGLGSHAAPKGRLFEAFLSFVYGHPQLASRPTANLHCRTQHNIGPFQPACLPFRPVLSDWPDQASRTFHQMRGI